MPPSEQDYRAIEQLLYRYAWMVDRRKWELMDEVTAPMGRPATGVDHAGGGQDVITNAGIYHDTLVRTQKGWRIAARFCDMTIQIGHMPSDYTIPD